MGTGQRPPRDPAVEAARITRTGAIVAAVLAAVITATATGTGAFFLGRERGEATASATTVTVTAVRTETVTGEQADLPDNSTKTGRLGPTTLLDLTPIEQDGDWKVEDRKVNTEQYEDVLTTFVGCNRSASRTYQIDRKYQRFRAEVGLTDDSNSYAVVEFQIRVDTSLIESATVRIGPGSTEQIDVDVSDAFRLSIVPVSANGRCGGDEATTAWFNTSLT